LPKYFCADYLTAPNFAIACYDIQHITCYFPHCIFAGHLKRLGETKNQTAIGSFSVPDRKRGGCRRRSSPCKIFHSHGKRCCTCFEIIGHWL